MTSNKNSIPPYEHLFTEKSLDRAYEYVDYIENVRLSQNGISCKVEGSYPYKVKITWDENDYTELSCTCPYDYGGYCKHIAAVLMYLEDELNDMEDIEFSDSTDNTDDIIDVVEIPHASNKKQKKKKKPKWQEIIEILSKEELQALIIEYAENNDNFMNTIIVKYGKSSDEVNIKKHKKIVDKIFDALSGDYGYMSYHDVYEATNLVDDLLDKATSRKDKKAFNEAFSISAAIAECCINRVQYVDDSDGAIGDLIHEAFNLVGEIFDKCKKDELKNQIFEWLTRQINNPNYSDYGCDDALSTIYFDLGSNDPYVDSVFQFIDNQLDKYKNSDDWSARYRYEELLDKKLVLLTRLGKEDEAQSIIENNLHLHDIRKVKVNQLLEQKEFSNAINCIKEGVKISERENFYGVTSDWNNLLLQIYEKQGLIDELRKLAKAMIFGKRDVMKYYLLLKKHTESDKWNEERISIIQNLKSKVLNFDFPYDLASIYIEEKMWSELLLVVETFNNISITSKYAKYLSNDFATELIEIYKKSISRYAEKTGRNYYEDIKSYLKEMSKLKNGLYHAKALKEELLRTYKNRPAMKQILEPLFR